MAKEQKKKALAPEKKALAVEKKALVAAKKAERGSRNITSGTNHQRGQKKSNQQSPRAAKLPRVSTDERAASSSTTTSSTTTSETDVSEWSHKTCCVCFALFQDDDKVED